MADTFPKVDKKLTKNLSPVAYALSSEGDTLECVYAGSDYETFNGRKLLAHKFVTDDGVATVLSRRQLDEGLRKVNAKPGMRLVIERGDDKHFKKDGEERSMHTFKVEKAR